jgi:hypothetical protein
MTAPALPPPGHLVTGSPWWRHPSPCLAGEGAAHLRVRATTDGTSGHLAVVTETGPRRPSPATPRLTQ